MVRTNAKRRSFAVKMVMQSKKNAMQFFAFSKNNAVGDFAPPHFYI